ncbi:MAG: ubiquinol-cytochrome C chaperone [Rhodospirillales bacterium]|nr:ubiquinol-cytochrome C chaperone [Rhodospirillales bacterium]
MAALGSLLRRRDPHRDAAAALYAGAVAAARAPSLFADLGVPDTLDGRFDSLSLFVILLIERLRRDAEPGPALAQSVFDAMFRDMDRSLRESGVGDPSMARQMRAMWNAFHGRALAYGAALAAGDAAALADALARNVWRGAPPPDGAAAVLAARALADAGHLRGQPLDRFVAGAAGFLPRTEATR